MKYFLYIFSAFISVVYGHNSTELKNRVDECKNEVGLEHLSHHMSLKDPKVKFFVTCLNIKVGLIVGDKLDVEKYSLDAERYYLHFNDSMKTKVSECVETANKEDNRCEILFAANKCVIEQLGKPEAFRWIEECVEEVKSLNGTSSKKDKCFNACLVKKRGTLSADGKIVMEKYLDEIKTMNANVDDNFEAEVAKCVGKANEETDECEVLTTAFKCVVEKYGELKKHEDQDASTPSTLQFFLKLSA